jgi:hypothetical protein
MESDSFASTERKNLENEIRLAEERIKANQSVLKAYRIKSYASTGKALNVNNTSGKIGSNQEKEDCKVIDLFSKKELKNGNTENK